MFRFTVNSGFQTSLEYVPSDIFRIHVFMLKGQTLYPRLLIIPICLWQESKSSLL